MPPPYDPPKSSIASAPVNSRGGMMVGSSTLAQAIKRDMAEIADSASTVLITGETGTGKELAAEFIHANSSRRNKALVCVNCAAIPESLLESELFGHAKGAFTGADSFRDGLFTSADGGTIFLDEIGDMSLCAQAKILRVLEKKEVCRVGSTRGKQLDLRFVAATNQDLEGMASRGAFRKDLYFRLNIARIHLPPLRERPEDIPSLLFHYCNDFSDKTGKPVPDFSEASLRCLVSYEWPGNIRELKNMVERLFLRRVPQTVSIEHLPPTVRRLLEESGEALPVERQQLLAALFECKWNKSEAAKKLHWSRMTLYRKIAKYQIAGEHLSKDCVTRSDTMSQRK